MLEGDGTTCYKLIYVHRYAVSNSFIFSLSQRTTNYLTKTKFIYVTSITIGHGGQDPVNIKYCPFSAKERKYLDYKV